MCEFFTLQRGITSLNEACLLGKSGTVNLLLKAGAKTDILDMVHDNRVLRTWVYYRFNVTKKFLLDKNFTKPSYTLHCGYYLVE